jgi:hypothetical protein
MSGTRFLNLGGEAATGPVECLGQTFASDNARRAHYLELLAEKLQDLAFRKHGRVSR